MNKTWFKIIKAAFLSFLLIGTVACGSDTDDDLNPFMTSIGGYIIQSFDGDTPQFSPYLSVRSHNYSYPLAEV